MDTAKYILRSLRYILRMVVLLALVFAVMAMLGLLEMENGNFIRDVLLSRNGLLLLGVLIILAGIYPRLSFVEARVQGDIHADRQKVKDIMADYGFVVRREEEDKIVFNASKFSRRLLSQFDDTVTVTGHAGRLYIEGMKRDVFRIENRLRSALDRDE